MALPTPESDGEGVSSVDVDRVLGLGVLLEPLVDPSSSHSKPPTPSIDNLTVLDIDMNSDNELQKEGEDEDAFGLGPDDFEKEDEASCDLHQQNKKHHPSIKKEDMQLQQNILPRFLAASAQLSQLLCTLPIPPSPVATKGSYGMRQDSKMALDYPHDAFVALDLPESPLVSSPSAYNMDDQIHQQPHQHQQSHHHLHSQLLATSSANSSSHEPEPKNNSNNNPDFLIPTTYSPTTSSYPTYPHHHLQQQQHHTDSYFHHNHNLPYPLQPSFSSSYSDSMSSCSDLEDDSDDDEVCDLMREEGEDDDVLAVEDDSSDQEMSLTPDDFVKRRITSVNASSISVPAVPVAIAPAEPIIVDCSSFGDSSSDSEGSSGFGSNSSGSSSSGSSSSGSSSSSADGGGGEELDDVLFYAAKRRHSHSPSFDFNSILSGSADGGFKNKKIKLVFNKDALFGKSSGTSTPPTTTTITSTIVTSFSQDSTDPIIPLALRKSSFSLVGGGADRLNEDFKPDNDAGFELPGVSDIIPRGQGRPRGRPRGPAKVSAPPPATRGTGKRGRPGRKPGSIVGRVVEPSNTLPVVFSHALGVRSSPITRQQSSNSLASAVPISQAATTSIQMNVDSPDPASAVSTTPSLEIDHMSTSSSRSSTPPPHHHLQPSTSSSSSAAAAVTTFSKKGSNTANSIIAAQLQKIASINVQLDSTPPSIPLPPSPILNQLPPLQLPSSKKSVGGRTLRKSAAHESVVDGTMVNITSSPNGCVNNSKKRKGVQSVAVIDSESDKEEEEGKEEEAIPVVADGDDDDDDIFVKPIVSASRQRRESRMAVVAAAAEAKPKSRSSRRVSVGKQQQDANAEDDSVVVEVVSVKKGKSARVARSRTDKVGEEGSVEVDEEEQVDEIEEDASSISFPAERASTSAASKKRAAASAAAAAASDSATATSASTPVSDAVFPGDTLDDSFVPSPQPKKKGGGSSGRRKSAASSSSSFASSYTDKPTPIATLATLKHPLTVKRSTYSKVTVWETLIANVAIMRRVNDGWVNVTHILKLAGFGAKAQRTRVLEKMHIGPHEKIQGGFGRYQGTWASCEDAIKIAQEYNVSDLLEPLFACKAEGGKVGHGGKVLIIDTREKEEGENDDE
ncbi:UNVERIFIED_CONTAM: hypothetical protein HDU68_011791 [Siphonaria sp. JEL0065]|nr:hypothetical protein HDU68_011791 [Siphonaria sp. JEL0065]